MGGEVAGITVLDGWPRSALLRGEHFSFPLATSRRFFQHQAPLFLHHCFISIDKHSYELADICSFSQNSN